MEVLKIFRANKQVLEKMIEMTVMMRKDKKTQDDIPPGVHDGDASEDYGDDREQEEEEDTHVNLPGSFREHESSAGEFEGVMRRTRKITAGGNYEEEIMDRIREKLHGNGKSEEQQVDELIKQATDSFNLALCYVGWCPFW